VIGATSSTCDKRRGRIATKSRKGGGENVTSSNHSVWQDVTTESQRLQRNEQYIRRIDDRCYISVLYRMTGFGFSEWETCIVDRDQPTRNLQYKIIRGDRRDELATMPKEKLAEWYAVNIEGNRNALETLIQAGKQMQSE
jgi:hypothetical protein